MEYGYPIGSFDVDPTQRRLDQIQHFGCEIGLAPKIEFKIDMEICTISICYKSVAKINEPITNEWLTKFADRIDFMHSKGLIHGDIKKSNIILASTGLMLIDWEPVLQYSVNKKVCFRSTIPYLSEVDIENGFVSRVTDLRGFYGYLWRLKFNEMTSMTALKKAVDENIEKVNAKILLESFLK